MKIELGNFLCFLLHFKEPTKFTCLLSFNYLLENATAVCKTAFYDDIFGGSDLNMNYITLKVPNTWCEEKEEENYFTQWEKDINYSVVGRNE
jgi:hypothetical protein